MKSFIEMRQDQYVLKSIYKPPVTVSRLIKSINQIDLNEHITNPSSPKNYELIGVISHLGKSSMEGHFVAYCKHFDESWYLFNDSNVSQDPGKGVYNGVPYILFYKNKNWNK